MLKKLNPYKVQKILLEKRIHVFTPRDLMRLFGANVKAVALFLCRHTKRGFFIRLRNGLYALDTHSPSVELIANRLYEPSYLSLEYALSHYHFIPETVYTLTSVTTKATREFQVQGVLYTYTRIKKTFYTGYTTKKMGNLTVLFAKPEKALADYLYLVDLGKKTLNDRLSVRTIQKRKLWDYVGLLGRDSLNRLVRQIL